MINTIEGEMETDLLWKREGTVEDENEFTTWVEYWKDWATEQAVLMHRSAHVTLKKSLLMGSSNETL
jgi:hypothetical protein